MSEICTLPLDEELLQRVLRIYKPNCRYLNEVTLEYPADRRRPHPDDPSSWIAAYGPCGFEASCYVSESGHLNAVEFNITYNQLLQAALAGAVQHGLIAELRHWNMDEFWRRQQPDLLIVDYHARFHRPMNPRAYRGRFEIRKVSSKPHKRLLLLQTASQVQDDTGGYFDAGVLIALARL